jgi:hypothetical protein
MNGLLDPGCKFDVLVHLVSGKVYRFAYGTSVLHAGGGVEAVEDADAVTVMTLAEIVGVTVSVVVFVTVAVDVIVVRNRVVVLVLTTVLVTITTPGQLRGLTHPPGQTWLSAIRHWFGGGLIVQTGRWACTIIVMAAKSAAIVNLICNSKSCVQSSQNRTNLTWNCMMSKYSAFFQRVFGVLFVLA